MPSMERRAQRVVALEVGLPAEPADAVDDRVDELPWFPDAGHRLDFAGRVGPTAEHGPAAPGRHNIWVRRLALAGPLVFCV
jgi:hypothetical protein